jgi:hypothetical protein
LVHIAGAVGVIGCEEGDGPHVGALAAPPPLVRIHRLRVVVMVW